MADEAYMGPLALPGSGYLTPAQRENILQTYGVVAVVRHRHQWGQKVPSLSGPVDKLVPARQRCMELLNVDNLESAQQTKAPGAAPLRRRLD